MIEERKSPVGSDRPHEMTENDLKAERKLLEGLLRKGELTPKEARRLTKIGDALDDLGDVRGSL